MIAFKDGLTDPAGINLHAFPSGKARSGHVRMTQRP